MSYTWTNKLIVSDYPNFYESGISSSLPNYIIIDGDTFRLVSQRSPLSNGDGNVGEICVDDTYIYVCTSADTWKRVELTGGY